LSLEAEMKRIASLVDANIKDSLKGEPELLYSASSYLIGAGGKRLRPLILLKFYSLYKNDEEKAIGLLSA